MEQGLETFVGAREYVGTRGAEALRVAAALAAPEILTLMSRFASPE
jgi:hypothetical protein